MFPTLRMLLRPLRGRVCGAFALAGRPSTLKTARLLAPAITGVPRRLCSSSSESSLAPATPPPVRLHIRTAPCGGEADDEHYVLITAEPPSDSCARAPTTVAVVVDRSGSMASAATVAPDADGDGEAYGLSLLDVVQHAASTVAESLESGDRLAIVAFDSKARVESALSLIHI